MKARKVVLLSYFVGEKDTFSVDIFKIFKPRLLPISRIPEGKMSNVSKLEIGLHSGTHIDVPRHFKEEGLAVDDFEITDLVFDSPLLISIKKNPGEEIAVEDLLPYECRIRKSDFLMIRTGFSRYRDSNHEIYAFQYPGLSPCAARYIMDNFTLRGVAVDLLSIENILKARGRGFIVHKIFLCEKEKFIIVEDVNLEPLLNKEIMRVFVIPLMIREAEASPATVFAEIR